MTLYDPVYGISTEHYFTVEFPFHVDYSIQSSPSANFQAYYWNGTAWADDKAFIGMPFDVDVTIQYYSCLLGSGIASFPDPSNLTVMLVNQSPVTWYKYYTANPVYLTLVSYNATTGQYNYTAKNLTTNTPINSAVPEKIVVIDNQNNLDNSAGAPEFEIYPLVMEITDVTTQPSSLFQWLPFNVTVTAQVFANISGSLVNFTIDGATIVDAYNVTLVDSTGHSVWDDIDLTPGIVVGGGQGSDTFTNFVSAGTYFNATWVLNQLKVGPAPFNASATYWPNYQTIPYAGNPIPINLWDIQIGTSITCTNGLACTEFYAGINQTLNISVTYPLSPYYNLTTTANYRVLLNGVEMYNGTINVINNSGWTVVPVSFPENGTVTVEVWDSVYHPEPSTETRSVVNWDIAGAYQVIQYPDTYNIYDTAFYVGIPANLTLGILYNEPCPLNSTVDITLELPDGTVLNYSAVVSDANSTTFNVPYTFLFTEPGFVTVTYHDSLGKSYSFTIPVKDWGIFVDVSPEELTEDESTNLNVFVVESLYFGGTWGGGPGTRDVTVTLELPDGYNLTKDLALEQNDDWFNGQGGYQGIITFENVTPQMPGIGWVIVTDVLSGKTVKMPIKINAAITAGNRWIDVAVVPANEPVYAYLSNSLKIDIQYMYSDGIAAYKDTNDHIVNITITDADGTTYHLQLPVDNGYVQIPNYAIPVNGTSDIAVSVVDAYNSSITGGAVVPVTPWNVTFDFATDGTVWEYVDNTLYVTVHVNGPNVPVNVTINGDLYTNVADGQVIAYPITDPQGTLTYNVIATYNGHQVGSDTYTTVAQPWNVTFDFATDGTVWEYVDNTLYVTVHVNGPNVPVDVTINGVPVGSYSDGDVIPIAIVEPIGTLTYNVVATYNGYEVGNSTYIVTAQEWNVTFDITVSDYLTGGPDLYMKFFGNLVGVVGVNGPNVQVNVSASWGDVGLLGDGDTFTHMFTQWTPYQNWTFEATYNGHVVGTADYTTYANSWDTIVSAPDELYYLPNGYTNENVAIMVELENLPQTIAESYNVTLELNVTLPDGTVILKTINGTNYGTFDLGDLTFNESGVITYTVTVIRGLPWGAVIDTASGTIPIELALDATVSPAIAYVNVPFDLTVNVTSIAITPNITVSIDGTNYTATAVQSGVVTIPDVVLTHAGTYTVVIHDAAISATITRTFEVRDWHIEVTAVPSNITAGSLYNVDFVITLRDEMGDIANIDDTAELTLEFSNASVIPSGFYYWTVPIYNGQGAMLNAPIFAPVAGTFQIIVTDMYGKVNDTETLLVNEPNPADLTYVYVNIRKEGSLEPPGEPVRLYWGLEIGGIKKYFPVYNPVYNADYSEAMFELYPQQSFNLYVIAVPESINYPIIEEGKNYTWEIPLQNVNETWYELNKTVTVTPVDEGWSVAVDVSKYVVNFVNITKDIYSLEVTNVPGLIQIVPGSASVQGNAIFSGITKSTYHYENFSRELVAEPASNSTTITVEPNELMLKLCDNTTLKPTQAGEYFTFKAMLSITNAEAQFDTQWMPFESWIQAIDFLNDTEKGEIISEILGQIGNVSALNGPVANETVYFHIDNTNIAYAEPTNATTDAMGVAEFRVYTKATGSMTPEELMSMMGSVTAWATYDGLATDGITVNFGGTGSISGDITDDSGNQIPGATVIVKYWNGTDWVNATDFEGNVLTAVSAEDGHYAISNVPASLNGTEYRVVAIYGDLVGYATVTVKPFETSTADVKLNGEVPKPSTFKVAIFRRGAWLIDYNGDLKLDDVFGPFGIMAGDVPLAGDFNGDGVVDVAIFRHGTWYIDYGMDYTIDKTVSFGILDGDVPLVGDMNGDGMDDLIIFRHGTWYIKFAPDFTTVFRSETQFGKYDGDVPLVADFDGDGYADPAIFRNGMWYVDLDHYNESTAFNFAEGNRITFGPFGIMAGDVPLAGDFNGDGVVDVAIFRHGTWYIDYGMDGTIDYRWVFGILDGDIPVVMK
ncbi:carboxypeptidase regulatory-like domain-containing protein [Thermococcus sp. MV11]|uniref:carboxypeptidase regulatory-like domain-containing protein n=1 Tax=Thermococcus sp. MV11 TaxID=1638267 RepID=UPI001430B35F|nr:carboxypeptidase regulatory-like domain-containing protein [Thermococcus sp. MV11]